MRNSKGLVLQGKCICSVTKDGAVPSDAKGCPFWDSHSLIDNPVGCPSVACTLCTLGSHWDILLNTQTMQKEHGISWDVPNSTHNTKGTWDLMGCTKQQPFNISHRVVQPGIYVHERASPSFL